MILYYNFLNVSNQINFDEYFLGWKNRIVLHFEGMKGVHRVVTHKISGEHGTLFETWRNIGSPETVIDTELLPFLKAHSVPSVRVKNVDFDVIQTLSVIVEPFEVILVEID